MNTIYALAGLGKNEVQILKLLEQDALLVNEISTALTIPRATLDRIMVRLFKRGFVTKHRRGKRHVFKATPHAELLAQYGLVTTQRTPGVRVYHGSDAMLELTKKFIQAHAKERVKVIQTKQTWDFWSTHLTPEQSSEINNLLRKQAVLNEGIFSEALLKEKQKDFFQTYTKRPSVVHVLPESYAQFATDITLTKKVVYIMNWRDGVGIEITSSDTVRAFNYLFSFIFDNTNVSSVYAHGSNN